ncbi:MAG: PhoH family protein [Candidatus Riflebacteria bacterium]|nr:PhoH family protein [Candidatus Riflebacteria bacterium]
MSETQVCINLSEELARLMFSSNEENGLSLIRSLPELSVKARGNSLTIDGDLEKIKIIKQFIKILNTRISKHEELEYADVRRVFRQLSNLSYAQADSDKQSVFTDILATHSGRTIKAKTANQKLYIDSIEKNTITIARGPAGTGKTYLAAAMAVKALKEKKISRIVLSRPVIEAGESLGYLPGDLKEKVDPHFRPLYDSLQDFIGLSKFEQFVRQGIIEITPLAYMRGRTFNESFVVLDEAQNTTLAQMRMILTRLGYGAKMVITGDQTQIDLPNPADSSLLILNDILGKVNSVKFVDLTSEDVVRHDVVRRIINAFDEYQSMKREKQ